jgi:hypothetical protein
MCATWDPGFPVSATVHTMLHRMMDVGHGNPTGLQTQRSEALDVRGAKRRARPYQAGSPCRRSRRYCGRFHRRVT